MNHEAIYNTHSNVISISDTEILDANGKEVTIDQSLVDTEVTRLQAEYDNAQYARDREQAYPPMADQLDDIFHNGVAGWKKTIQAVKDTYPKPV
jgi:hypothetical protein